MRCTSTNICSGRWCGRATDGAACRSISRDTRTSPHGPSQSTRKNSRRRKAMDAKEMAQINALLQRFYGDRLTGLTLEMAALWYEQLRGFPADLAAHAVKRWAADHLPHQPPTLTQLVTQIEDLQAEQRRQRAAAGQRVTLPEQGERDDAYSSAEVKALIRSVWPEMYPDVPAPMKPEERDARVAFLKEQVRQILADEEQS